MKKAFICSLTFHFATLIGVFIGIILMAISKWNNYILLVIMGILYCISYIIMYTFFSKYTNAFPKNKLTQNIIRESDLKNDFDIIATDRNGIYTLNINGREINIGLSNYLFKKNYIVALLIRNFRYYSVSNKRPLKYLFSHKIKVSNANLNCKILFYKKGDFIKEVKVINDSVSKVNFLQNQVNKSKYYTYFYSNWSQSQYINKHICRINEQIYQDGKMDDTNWFKNK